MIGDLFLHFQVAKIREVHVPVLYDNKMSEPNPVVAAVKEDTGWRTG